MFPIMRSLAAVARKKTVGGPFGGNATLATNCVAYYKADDDATDELGNNNGTFSAATYTTGKINNGFSLDGVNDSVTGVYQIPDATSFSVSAWIYVDNLASSRGIYKTSFTGTSPQELIWLSVQGSKLYLQMRGNTGALVTAGGTSTLSTATWYHVVCTYNSADDAMEVFLNDSSEGTNTYTGVSWSDVATSAIGEITGSSTFWFDGVIDEVGIWTKVLSATEITDLYNSGSGLSY